MKTNPLVALGRAGQSPWLDYIHRGMISSGELARRIAEDGIRGVTSNPTIFEKAVSSGRDYDAQIRALARGGAKLLEAYKAIVTDDIRAAFSKIVGFEVTPRMPSSAIRRASSPEAIMPRWM